MIQILPLKLTLRFLQIIINRMKVSYEFNIGIISTMKQNGLERKFGAYKIKN